MLAGKALLRGLYRAKRIYNRRQNPEYTRDATLAVLGELVQGIALVPRLQRRDLAWPLIEFMGALSDLDEGKVADFLKPKRDINRRPPDSTKTKQTKGLAAGALEALINLGIQPREAASSVVQALKKCGVPIGNPKTEGTQIDAMLSWRENIRRDKNSSKAAGPIERETYDDLLKVLGSSDAGESTENRRKRLLHGLSSMIALMYPKIQE